MMRFWKLALLAPVAWAAFAFVPNTLTDRADRRDVRDNVMAGARTASSLTGRLFGLLRGEFVANHTRTPLPEESQRPTFVQVQVNGKVQGAAE